jgi:hypothetical protein
VTYNDDEYVEDNCFGQAVLSDALAKLHHPEQY